MEGENRKTAGSPLTTGLKNNAVIMSVTTAGPHSLICTWRPTVAKQGKGEEAYKGKIASNMRHVGNRQG